MVRQWGISCPPRFRAAVYCGRAFEGMAAPPEDTASIAYNTKLGLEALLFPQGQGRVRAYLVYPKDAPYRLHGATQIADFVEESIRAGIPYHGMLVRIPWPLPHIVVPQHGSSIRTEQRGAYRRCRSNQRSDLRQGLSLTLRDVRELRDQLLSQDDWGGRPSIRPKHHRYFGVVHTAEGWLTAMFHETGPVADARRARALPLIAQDATRRPDVTASGPDCVLDETARRRFFGD
jgi:hypothetical protein